MHAARPQERRRLAAAALAAGAALAVMVAVRSGSGLDAAPEPRAAVSEDVVAALQERMSVPVIITLRGEPQPSPSHAQGARRAIAAAPAPELTVTRRYGAVPALAGIATKEGVAALAAQPDVLHIGLDLEVRAQLEEARALIGADDVHSSLGVTGEGVTVAVLDTGIDTDHPLLSDDLVHEHCFLSDESCPGGGATGASAEDGNGHGTHVSGIITSAGPPTGIAPDAEIAAYKVLNNGGSGTLANVLAAYDEILLNHPEVDVVNMSLAFTGSFAPDACDPLAPSITTAIAMAKAQGIISFAATGNSGSKTGISYPACMTDVASVGAVYDADLGAVSWTACDDASSAADQVVCFSQSHPGQDLLAPGAATTSTQLGGGIGVASGTSMASPAAAAVAALLRESEPGLTPDQMVTRLVETGAPILDAANGVTVCRVDAYEAVLNDGGPECAPSGPPGPLNDDFVNAASFGGTPPQTAGQSTVFATTEPSEPLPCAGIASTVWFRLVPDEDAQITADTLGSQYDAALAAYEGEALDALTELDCNDDTFGQQSRVEFTAEAGKTYYLQAGGFLGSAGELVLNVATAPPPPPTKQPAGDTDGDGCDDVTENGVDEAAGGRRDYLNGWDFYDVNGDRQIDLFDDVFGVATAFGTTAGAPDYDAAFDRSPPPTAGEEPDPNKREPWDMGPPDGDVDLFGDVFGVAFQFGHACA